MIQVQDIHTFYGRSHILQGVNLHIELHEIVCLLGRNGAGKTTTLKSIMGLTPPRRGSITFEGEELAARKHIRSRGRESAMSPRTGGSSRC